MSEEKPKKVKLAVPPVLVPLEEELQLFYSQRETFKARTRYDLYRDLISIDAELFGAVQAMALCIASSLKGFTVKYGQQLDEEEQAMYDELQELWKTLQPYAYDIAFKIIRDGDAVYRIIITENEGITGLQYLPMSFLTAREFHPDTGKLETDPIQVANYYILNEGSGMKQQVFSSNEVIHFNWGRQELVTDILGRRTLGIWNKSPLESLKAKILWKHTIIINDMLWRSLNVPREHHKLPSEPFNPDNFTGDTIEERIERAKQAARQALEEYRSQLSREKVERAYITFDDVEIEIIEPKLKYTDPNELLEQLDDSIYTCLGVPRSAVSEAKRTSYASELVVFAYFRARTTHLANLIAKGFIRLAELHLLEKFKDRFTKHFSKIGFRIHTELFMRELARTIAILAATGLFTQAELRALAGFSPQPIGETVASNRRIVRSPQQQLVPEMTSEQPASRPLTPQSEEVKQLT